MILADTTLWITHFVRGNLSFKNELEAGRILVHPFVIGELSLGGLKNRKEKLDLLQYLPKAIVARDAEVMEFIEGEKLYSTGIGWVDAHLLASAKLSECRLWTLDKKLEKVASLLNVN